VLVAARSTAPPHISVATKYALHARSEPSLQYRQPTVKATFSCLTIKTGRADGDKHFANDVRDAATGF